MNGLPSFASSISISCSNDLFYQMISIPLFISFPLPVNATHKRISFLPTETSQKETKTHFLDFRCSDICFLHFFDASSHLYQRVCPSVHQNRGKNAENGDLNMWLYTDHLRDASFYPPGFVRCARISTRGCVFQSILHKPIEFIRN